MLRYEAISSGCNYRSRDSLQYSVGEPASVDRDSFKFIASVTTPIENN